MRRCKLCSKLIAGFKRNQVFCAKCGGNISREVESCIKRINNSFLSIKSTNSIDSKLDLINQALLNAGKIMRFERSGYVHGTEKGAELLSKIKQIKNETLDPKKKAESLAGNCVKSPLLFLKDIYSRDFVGDASLVSADESRGGSGGDGIEALNNYSTLEIDRSDFIEMLYPKRVDSERRRSERKKVQVFTIIYPGGLRAVIQNVSMSGLLVSCESTWRVGDDARLTLLTTKGAVGLRGIVRAVREGAGRGFSGKGIGLGMEFAPASHTLLRETLTSVFGLEDRGERSVQIRSYAESSAA